MSEVQTWMTRCGNIAEVTITDAKSYCGYMYRCDVSVEKNKVADGFKITDKVSWDLVRRLT